MKNTDWKNSLNALYAGNPEFESLKKEGEALPDKKSISPQHLRIELDKKGRNGKQATLVTGFEGSDDELKSFARELKTTCGVGGSTRDGEILIQGDVREKICKLLTEQGHKVKRINF
jgi:translation initiation factor 1